MLREIGATGEALLSLGFMRRFDPGYVQLRAGDRRRDGRNARAGAQHQPRRERRPERHVRVLDHRFGDPRVRRGAVAAALARRRGVVGGAAPLVAGPRGPPGPAADPPAHGRRRALHLRDLPQRPLRLRHPLRGRRRDRGDQPDRARAGAPRRRAAARHRLRRRLAAAVRRRLPHRAAGLGRLRAGRRADAARDRAGRRRRERGRRGRHHVDARGRREVHEGASCTRELSRRTRFPRIPPGCPTRWTRRRCAGACWAPAGSRRSSPVPCAATPARRWSRPGRGRWRRRRSSPGGSGSGGPTARTPISSPTPRSTSSTSPRRTTSTTGTPCSRSTRASTCWWRSRSR